jgi:hypothetical protein
MGKVFVDILNGISIQSQLHLHALDHLLEYPIKQIRRNNLYRQPI